MLCMPCQDMPQSHLICFFFFFNDTATTEIYTLSLHDALPIPCAAPGRPAPRARAPRRDGRRPPRPARRRARDRKSTRLNSSHSQTSYAVFCLKKKKKKIFDPSIKKKKKKQKQK